MKFLVHVRVDYSYDGVEPSMESAAGVEPAGLSHWTTSGKEGDGSHRQQLSKVEGSIKR